jgi:acyl carrier protein
LPQALGLARADIEHILDNKRAEAAVKQAPDLIETDTASPPVVGAAAYEEVDRILRAIMVDVLGLGEDQVAAFDAKTGLFGYLPELDSMAVATLLTEMEDRLNIVIEDDEVDGELLENFGALLMFSQEKRSQG